VHRLVIAAPHSRVVAQDLAELGLEVLLDHQPRGAPP
jgi:hypothetical protein